MNYDAYLKTQTFEKKADVASLIILGKGDSTVRSVPLPETAKIGRRYQGSNSDIMLDSAIVSRNHGMIETFMGRHYYKDLNSLNGTYINGVKLRVQDKNGSEYIRLQDGDILRIDHKDLNYPHPEAVTLVFSESFDSNTSTTWATYDLKNKGNIVIGRDADSEIALKANYISGKHAEIFCRNDRYYIKNCGSKNGVLVNNQFIYTEVELFERNVIKICDVIFFLVNGKLIYNTSVTAPEKVDDHLVIDVNDINPPIKPTPEKKTKAEVKKGGLAVDIEKTVVGAIWNRKILLKDIKVKINDGEFVLVLGGSGAGKSTLFNSILGKYDIRGSVKLVDENGSEKGKPNFGYVPQTLNLRKEEKVIDVMWDNVNMRMVVIRSTAEKEAFIQGELKKLGLGKKTDMLIKNLSGGEQRRAVIAAEAVIDPDIFFLDEPDSGLDPKSGMELMTSLRSFSDEGKIVMLITHNYASYPDPEKIYSKVLVLAKSDKENVGKLAFYGSVPEALEFFEVNALRDITRLINPKAENGEGRADEFVEKFRRKN